MFSFSMLFLNELVKTKQNDFYLRVFVELKIGKTVVRGKEKYSLVEQKELVSKLAGKYKKGCDKVVKALQKKTHYPYKRKKKTFQ